MREAGFNKTSCAPVHLARSAFIHAASRGARVRTMEKRKGATCAPRRISVYAASRAECTGARVKSPKPAPGAERKPDAAFARTFPVASGRAFEPK